MLPVTSKTTTALRILEELLRARGSRLHLRELETRTGINFYAVWDTVSALALKGICQTSKGPTGGVALSNPDATLWDVATAVERPMIHHASAAWSHVESYLERTWKRTVIRELVRDE